MIICGNLPPLKPLWDRLFADKSRFRYRLTGMKYDAKSYQSGLSSIPKDSLNGVATRILSSQHDDMSQGGSQVDQSRIKAVTDINVVKSTSMV